MRCLRLPAVVAAALLVPACAEGGGTTSSPAEFAPAACLDTRAATQIWHDVSRRLNAVTLDRAHAGLSGATTGGATVLLQRYIARELVGKNLVEREDDRLDGLTVVSGACSGTTALVVDVRETLVQDDYLAPDGHVDHADPRVGKQSHLRKSYSRLGATWKLSDIQDLDTPPPTVPPDTV